MSPRESKFHPASYDALFASIQDLVMRHSPSGVEHAIDSFLKEKFEERGIKAVSDASGNLVAHIPGRGRGKLAITAHKDEIGAIVTAIEEEGRVRIRKLGTSFPWVYGEGVVDLIGESRCVTGILSFGSRHVSHASPQSALKDTKALQWCDTWVETKLTATELEDAGIRAGTRMVVGKHRKTPIRIKNHIASYALDNKASLAILLELAHGMKDPLPDLYLVASAKEEVGAVGALYFAQKNPIDALVALEVCPIAPEYPIYDGVSPVLLAEDAVGLYDERLNSAIRSAAKQCDVSLQTAILNGFGSDGSIAAKAGYVPRAACLGFPTQNTHGFEIAPLGAIQNCLSVLLTFCSRAVDAF